MLASMHCVQRSLMCKTWKRGYWVISAVNIMTCRSITLHITENYLASKMQYLTGNSTNMEPSNHFWYTRTRWPCVELSRNHTSLYYRWISWRSSKILTERSGTSQVSWIRLQMSYRTIQISDGCDEMYWHWKLLRPENGLRTSREE